MKIEAARIAARKQIELLYRDTCTVYTVEKVKDPITKLTTSHKVVSLENQKCKLSFSSVEKSGEKDNAATIEQVIKLFVSPEVVIKPGSTIEVLHMGEVLVYKSSGQYAKYPTHQEIVLELNEEYA